MTESHDDLKVLIEQLTKDVRSLAGRVERLERAVKGAPSREGSPAPPAPVRPAAADKQSPWSVGGVAALMSRGAVISLVLLLALVLRTLTDSGVLGMGIGTMLGIGYATLLEGAGWLLYRKESPFAPIFSISGALLLVAVVLESHSVFGSISTLPAYLLLAVAGGGMAVISRQSGAAIPVSVGTMAVLLAGVSMGVPEADFRALTLFLIAVNIMAFTAVKLPRTGWLRVVTFFFTAVVILLWGYKLRFAILSGGGLGSGSTFSGTAPFHGTVAFYLFFYIAMPGVAIWKRGSGKKRPFDHMLPTMAAAWAYLTSLMVVTASGSGQRVLGVAGVAAATLLLGLAAVKGRRTGTRSRGTTTFAFPAALLLALSFRDVSGESVVALAILSWGALSLAWLSSRWESAGVRVTSYYLQLTVLGASALLLLVRPAGGHPAAAILSMAVTSMVAFTHYRLVRKMPPPGENAYFARFDRSDISGTAPLLVCVGTGFLAVRAVLFTLLTNSPVAFQAAETIVINTGALALFLLAKVTRNAEVKWVAVLVTILGGGKIFLYDLFKVKGVPVVLSVLSFVLVAGVGSWVLGKWPRRDTEPVAD